MELLKDSNGFYKETKWFLSYYMFSIVPWGNSNISRCIWYIDILQIYHCNYAKILPFKSKD